MRLFGSVAAQRGSMALPLGAPAQRVVFTLLALVAGRPVTHAELVGALWPRRPPTQATNVLQTYVKHLRRILEPGRATRGASALLPRRGDGYMLAVPPGSVDVLRFKQCIEQARVLRRDGDDRRLLPLLEAAFAGSGESPAADLPMLAEHPWVVEVGRLRRQALGWYAEAALRSGTCSDALPVVERAALQPSSDEAVHCWLMRMLCAAGRPADAVESYHRVQRRLADEFGIDPGPDLRAAYVEALRAAHAPAEASAGLPAPPPPLPAQLPTPVPHFTGRTRYLRRLDRMLAATTASDASRIWTIVGAGGVGKTTVAVHWAQRVRGRFPDGQLYVDLRGYGPETPLDPDTALHRLLSTLGVPAGEVPPERDARSALLRSHLAGLRMLILLDNARHSDQVRPLLPGTSPSLVMVTSRSQLRGLTARHGARRLTVQQLDSRESFDLIARLVGDRRTEAEPAAVTELVELCGRLPLALCIVGERAQRHVRTRLQDVADDLRNQRNRLDALRTNDAEPLTDTRVALSWSYHALPAAAARLFRLLGLHPAADFDAHATAALAGTTEPVATDLLDALNEVHLVQRWPTARYTFHDLVGEFARQLATEEPAAVRLAATDRLTGYYLHTAAAAATLVAPYPTEHELPIPAPPGIGTPLPDTATAIAWLDAERPTLLALATALALQNRAAELAALSGLLYRYLDGCDPHAAVRLHSTAAVTAHRSDPAAEGQARNRLGVAYWRLGQNIDALTELHAALALSRAAGDLTTGARIVNNIGLIYRDMGRFEEALTAHRRAHAIFEEATDPAGAAMALHNMGLVHLRTGRAREALHHCEQALRAYRNPVSRCRVIHDIGVIYRDLGQYRQAAAHLHDALNSYRERSNAIGSGHTLLDLGILLQAQGSHAEAEEHLGQALAIGRDTGERGMQITALNALADTAHATGATDRSRTLHRAALSLARKTGDQHEQNRAREGLRRVQHNPGRSQIAERRNTQTTTLSPSAERGPWGPSRK